jgi:tRNA(adenine34) deaminase
VPDHPVPDHPVPDHPVPDHPVPDHPVPDGVAAGDARAALAARNDHEAMGDALEEARAAMDHDDIPVGAVVIVDGQVIARAHNERERLADPTAHAELLALRAAATILGTWRLSDVTLAVTLEPCPMCAGGLVAARVGRLVFGAFDPRAGACGTLYNLCSDPRLNHELSVKGGVRAEECASLLRHFFAARRR